MRLGCIGTITRACKRYTSRPRPGRCPGAGEMQGLGNEGSGREFVRCPEPGPRIR